MKYRWSISPPQPLLADQIARALSISPLLAQCLVNRGLTEIAAVSGFLEPRLKQLADPFLIPNMAAAVERLFRAREQREALVVFGDYDVDGVTSTALLLETLRPLGWSVQAYLPHRMEEGYGLSQDAVENCLKKYPVTLLVAVDCGSTSVDSIAWLQSRGVDVIVIDHHQISVPAPAPCALVNPRSQASGFSGQCSESAHCRPASSSPMNSTSTSYKNPDFDELCSVGLAFKVAHALVKRAREAGLPGAAEFDLRLLLDLVALGTIADLVPLTGENRILVSAGLERLSSTKRPGLIALKSVAKSVERLGTYEVGFQLAPRLNAAGRLENAEESLRLLLASEPAEALALARSLDTHNRERQAIERRIAEEVIAVLRTRFNPQEHLVIVEGQSDWHLGVVGIVASRVLHHFYRPTIIVGGDGVQWRGSGRSIAGFDLAAALRECSDLLIRHGGHAMAAGVTIQPTNLGLFRSRLNDLARRFLTAENLQAPLHLDAEVGLEEMTLDSLAVLDRLKPTGQANPATQFFSRNLAHQRPLQRMGAEKQHVKMWITDGTTRHEAVWWNAGKESLPVGKFDLAFTPQINDYNGRRTIQLKTLDWRAI